MTAQKALLEFGITSIHDFDPWDCYPAYRLLEKSGDLHLRVMKGIPLPNWKMPSLMSCAAVRAAIISPSAG
jgi:predicted amidohydrolase YtcJ